MINMTLFQIVYYSIGIAIGAITLATLIAKKWKDTRKKKRYSDRQKERYYSKRMNDFNLSAKQREYAAKQKKKYNKKQSRK